MRSDAHSLEIKTDEDKLLNDLQSMLLYSFDESRMKLMTFFGPIKVPNDNFQYRQNIVDCVFAEMFATAYFLAKSPDIAKLEEMVRSEFNE